ncbi:MAG: hypothetical protein C0622_11275, partial [Desulfuromonas sp.]
MKVTMTRQGWSASEDEQLFSSANIEQELIRQGQTANLSICLDLFKILKQEISAPLLASLGLAELVENLRMAGEFLCTHDEDINVGLVKLKGQGHYYLFTNSPDANHIFSSLQEYLHRRALHFRVICHPLIYVQRDAGTLKQISESDDNLSRESFIWFELERLPSASLEKLKADVQKLLAAAVKAYDDRTPMLERFAALAEVPGLEQYADLFDWLQQDSFIPVAARRYSHRGVGQPENFLEETDAALGLTEFYDQPFHKAGPPHELTPESVYPLLGHEKCVDLEKTGLRCPLHRFERLTYLGFREELGEGCYREHSFWGFYTQKSIDENSYAIPALCKKIERAQQLLNIHHDSHNYRKTIQIINSFPKIELFLMSDDDLARMIHSFTLMHRQAGVKVIVAPGASETGLTLLLIMPNDYYLPEHIERMEAYLKRAFKAQSVETRLIHIGSDYLSLHANLMLDRKEVQIDPLRLEEGLTRLAMPWKLKFRELLEKNFPAESFTLWERYIKAFHKDYRARTHPRFAVRDVHNIERLLREREDAFDLWGPFHEQGDYYRLQYYSFSRSYLNDLMPLLQNHDLCVLHEIDSDLVVGDDQVYIKSFAIRPNVSGSLPF